MCKNRRPCDRQLSRSDRSYLATIFYRLATLAHRVPVQLKNGQCGLSATAEFVVRKFIFHGWHSANTPPFPPPHLLISAIILFITCVEGGGGSTVRNFNIPLLRHCAKSYQCCGSLRIRINLTDPNPYYCNNSDPDLK